MNLQGSNTPTHRETPTHRRDRPTAHKPEQPKKPHAQPAQRNQPKTGHTGGSKSKDRNGKQHKSSPMTERAELQSSDVWVDVPSLGTLPMSHRSRLQ